MAVELELHAERRLPDYIEVAAYYVASETLANAVKHAAASVVTIELDAAGPVLRLEIWMTGSECRSQSGIGTRRPR